MLWLDLRVDVGLFWRDWLLRLFEVCCLMFVWFVAFRDGV